MVESLSRFNNALAFAKWFKQDTLTTVPKVNPQESFVKMAASDEAVSIKTARKESPTSLCYQQPILDKFINAWTCYLCFFLLLNYDLFA